MLKPVLLFVALFGSTLSQQLTCPSDWCSGANFKSCYKVLSQPGGFTFDQGNAKCKELGGQLASIHSAAEGIFVAELASQGRPIGNRQTLIGAQRTGPKKDDWKWSDGTKWDYTAWSQGNPDNHSGKQGCVQLFASPYGPNTPTWAQQQKWDDEQCSVAYQNVVCKRAAGGEAPLPSNCDAGWSTADGLNANCYKAITGKVNFDQGNAKCKEMGAQLVSVHSAAESKFVSELANALNQGKPIGDAQTLIGAIRKGPKPSDWGWSDGTKWDYSEWATNLPNNYELPTACVQLLAAPYGANQPGWFQWKKWDDVNCGTVLQNYVCKKAAGAGQPVTQCPADWKTTTGLISCYKTITQPGGFSFAQGDAKCKELGAELTSVHSEAENTFIATISNTGSGQGGAQTLIGAQRTGPKPADWKWTDGTTWDYTNWSTSNPDNGGAASGIGQGCIQAFSSPYGANPPNWYQSQKWDDRSCDNFVNAVCKKSATINIPI